jgi:hypothetical protein
MIANQNDLFGGLDHGQQTLRLDCLGGLVDEDVVEVLIVESTICGGDASGADDIRSLDDVVFCLLP